MIRISIIIIALAALPASALADPTWTVETHSGVTYGRSSGGRAVTTETHDGVTYGESNDGRRWTSETHNGVTYVHPRP
jgi:hypothetical protein